MAEIAVIGNPGFTLGFRLVGVRKTVDADEPIALADAARTMLRDHEVGILVMDQSDFDTLPEHLQDTIRSSTRPTLVAIGMNEDSALREQIKQAVGVDLWKD